MNTCLRQVRTGAGVISAATTLLLVAPSALLGQEAKLTLKSSGASRELGGYMPQRLPLETTKPDALKKAPADLSAPLYGQIKIGPAGSPQTVLLVLDEPEDKEARLWVDSNGNGDLTDDGAAKWQGRVNSAGGQGFKTYSGGATVKVRYGTETLDLNLEMYRFDKNDPNRSQLKNTLLYYRDYAYAGEVKLGDKTFKAMLSDDLASGDFRGKEGQTRSGVTLLLDANGNGQFDRRGEMFDVRKPFNVGGTTYEIKGLTAAGGTFNLVKSDQTVDEVKPPPSLAVGDKPIAFERKTTAGKTVNYPADYKGKLIMLDFWATWCGPCRMEIPNLVKTYEKYKDQGFAVLGISFDQANATEKLAKFTEENKMPWPQIYDGKGWQAELGQMYGVDSIPRCLLVNGDTGLIVATTDALRGDQLEPTLKKELEKLKK